MSGHFVIVTGSPGAGKSTIVDSINGSEGYRVANVGTLMLEEAKKLGYTDDRDRIRYMEVGRLDEVRVNAFKELSAYDGNVVVDTHNYVEENGRFVPGLPMKLLEGLGGIEAFIYVNAEESDIIDRRRKDTTRTRELEDTENMKVQKTLNLSVLAYYSSLLNVPLYLINNRNGRLEESKARFHKILNEVFEKIAP